MVDNDTIPVTASLTMDRSTALGNSQDVDGRRAIHVKIKNTDLEPIKVNVTAVAEGPFDQGVPNTIPNAWPVKPTDGVHSQSYTVLDEAKVSITQPLPAGANALGSVSVSVSALPAGAATDASLGVIEAKLDTLHSDLGAVESKQDTLNASVSTSANQVTQSGKLDTINTNLGVIQSNQTAQETTLTSILGQVDAKTSTLATSANQTSELSKLDTLHADLVTVKDKQDIGNTTLSSINSAMATAANQSTELTRVGDVTETAPASDTASSGLNGRLQRLAQRITSLINLFLTPGTSSTGIVGMPILGVVNTTHSSGIANNVVRPPSLNPSLGTRMEISQIGNNIDAAADFGTSANALRTASQVGNATGAADFGAGVSSAQTQRVVLATDQAAGKDSVGNSTTTPLGSNGVFTGTFEDVSGFAMIVFSIFADQASAANGFLVQWSSDGSNIDLSDSGSVNASSGRGFSLTPRAKYFRIVYTNGAVAQGAFRLKTSYHFTGTGLISRLLGSTIDDNNFAQNVRAMLNAKDNTTGNYTAVNKNVFGELIVGGSNSFRNLTGNATTTVKSGAGVLNSICWNNPQSGGTIALFDNTAGSGTLIATLTMGTLGSAVPGCQPVNAAFSTGLTAVTAGSVNNNFTLYYK